jgi:uncharacterized membrane protein HdeD (DUF308 family)
MLNSLSKSLLWRGLFGVAIGIVAIVWPGVTIGAIVIIFAIAAFAYGGTQAVAAFSSDRAGPVVDHLLLALLDVAAGVVALAWPGITAYALTIWIGAWAVVTGIWEFGMASATRETAGVRALFGLGGLISVAFGIALFARPDLGAVSLALVFGFYSLAWGISSLVLAASGRRTGAEIHKTLRLAA